VGVKMTSQMAQGNRALSAWPRKCANTRMLVGDGTPDADPS